MNARTLKIALAASVALNLFAVAGGGAFLFTRAQENDRIEAQRKPGREGSLSSMVAGMEPELKQRVRRELRASALAARPDFDLARQARRDAIDRANAETFDPVAVQTLLEQSRLAEMRGRAQVEAGAIGVLGTLELEDRRALTPILARRGPKKDRDTTPAPATPAAQ